MFYRYSNYILLLYNFLYVFVMFDIINHNTNIRSAPHQIPIFRLILRAHDGLRRGGSRLGMSL